MEKEAQKRGPVSKLKEKANIGGKLVEKFSPEFQELMDNLREVDDAVREEAAELKGLVKIAQTNFNRKEYMTAAAFLGQFHEKVEKINELFSRLTKLVDIKHHEFLFGDVDQEHLDYLVNKLGPRFDKSRGALSTRASLEKEASITDWWHNITTERGRALSGWEKRFPKETKELKKVISNLITKSQSLLDNLLASLKAMGNFRASRKLEDYLKLADKWRQKYRTYDTTFGIAYKTNIKKFVDIQKDILAPKVEPDTLKELQLDMPNDLPGANGPKSPSQETAEDRVERWEAKPNPILEEWNQKLKEKNILPVLDIVPSTPKETLTEEKLMRNTDGPTAAKSVNDTVPDTMNDIAFESTMISPPVTPVTHKESPNTEESGPPTEETSPPTIEDVPTKISLQAPVKDKPINVAVTPPKAASYEEFIGKLEALANSPALLKLEIVKQAKKIKESDPETSEKLYKLAKSIEE